MTDEQIIKALEYCSYWESDKSCEECPANTYGFSCANKMAKHYLDLINSQKAEIERLKDLITYKKQEIKEKEQKYNQAVDDMFGLIETTRNEIAEAKSETIKEFAKKLKKRFYLSAGRCVVDVYHIDNLVKEMTEE